MQLKDLNIKYDKLQLQYGAKELNAIYNGGCEKEPIIFFVFMNPTAKNIASLKSWGGIKSPWIGTKNIWKLFYEIGLLDNNIYLEIKKRKREEWDESFADLVYENVKKHQYFITNLGKCTQIDARPISNLVYKKYLNLLLTEIEITKPKIIVTFGNQVSSIFLDKKISVSQCRKKVYKKVIANKEYSVYPTFYPIGNGLKNLDKVIEDLSEILKEKI